MHEDATSSTTGRTTGSTTGASGGAPWWTSAVVYQVYPRSFADSDGDGIGDIPGITAHLDHLEDLGVDVVWLSPVYRSPQDDNGYDISDYDDVDPTFGTLADLDALIAGLHARGMKLLMDLVVNHTSDEHPWFRASRSSRDDPQRDWYWWRPPRPGTRAGEPGSEPTDWESFFSGPAWELDEATGEHYLHLFSRKQPDLNWDNPEVRAAVHAMMGRWLDRGVDGFRMDVINFISKRTGPGGELADAPVADGGERVPGRLGDGTAEFTCGPRLHEHLREIHDVVLAPRIAAGRELLTVGEMPGVTVEQAALFTDPARRELDMVFQFEHVGLDSTGAKWNRTGLDLRDLKASLGRWQAGLEASGWNSLYWNNHDQPRAVSRFGDDSPEHRVRSATALATLLHLHRGTPYVYQGEELGMRNAPLATIGEFRDIESLNHHRQEVAAGRDPEEVLASMRWVSRDNARTPVPWDSSAHRGFTTGEPWITAHPDPEVPDAAAQRADDGSVFAHYRRLIALRHELPVVALGDFRMLAPEHPQLYAFTRTLGEESLLVLVDARGEGVDLAPLVASGELPSGLAGAPLVLGNLPSGETTEADRLAPWEARVVRLS